MSSNYCGLVKDIPGALNDTDDEVRTVAGHAIIEFSDPVSVYDTGPGLAV